VIKKYQDIFGEERTKLIIDIEYRYIPMMRPYWENYRIFRALVAARSGQISNEISIKEKKNSEATEWLVSERKHLQFILSQAEKTSFTKHSQKEVNNCFEVHHLRAIRFE
jgi:hypothetical protein